MDRATVAELDGTCYPMRSAGSSLMSLIAPNGSTIKTEEQIKDPARPVRRDCAEGDSVTFTQHYDLRRQWLAGLMRGGAQRLFRFFRAR